MTCESGAAATKPKGLALPVRAPAIRPSRASRWRAGVLIGVHVLIAIHIAHWKLAGRTLAPLEPSEGMQFSKQGIVNAGLIFFAITILSTLVLGRWFCGWGCHLVALQDLSRWALGKLGLRPRPLRARVLGAVPLVAFLYMFVGPLFYRLLRAEPLDRLHVELSTNEFWATFPSWLPAAMTFIVCGFFAIYFLGAKGFCTYGCPYGGIFGVADQLAPLRIRVTDACEHCGHCTAVCSSNVRVHEEVRDYGAVIDPGCMKCLDCVSVCPNDALYVGVGLPALWTAPRSTAPKATKRETRRRPARPPRARAWGRRALTAAFVLASMLVFIGFDSAYLYSGQDLAVAAGLSAGALLILAPFGGKGRAGAQRGHDLLEEITLCGVFLATNAAFRGLFGIAFLYSLGLSAVLAYFGLQALRLVRWRDVAAHRFRLKVAGRLRPAGGAFVALGLGLLAATALAGAQQIERADRLRPELRLARLRAEGRAVVRQAQAGLSPALLERAGRVLGELIERDPASIEPVLTYGMLLTGARHFSAARELYERAARHAPDNAALLVNRGVLEAEAGDLPRATGFFEQAVAAAPGLPQARSALGQAHLASGRLAEAVLQYRAACDLDPTSVDAWLGLAQALGLGGDLVGALAAAREAQRIAPQRADTRALIQLLERGGQTRPAPPDVP